MSSRATRTALIVAGVIAIIVGAVFAGQGLNLIPGSFMTGNRTWLYIGLAIVVAGLVLIRLAVKRPVR